MSKNRFARRALSLLLAVASLLTLTVPALAFNNASDWAVLNLQEAQLLGLLPEDILEADMLENITRQEMCHIAALAYEQLTGNTPNPNRTDYFTDTNDALICAAYEIGIVDGDPDGSFRPDDLLTRQEFFVILSNLNSAIGLPIHLPEDYLKRFPDRDEVANWAESAAQEVVALGIVNGTTTEYEGKLQTILAPVSSASRQEAVTMFLRDFKTTDEFLRSDWFTEEELEALKEAARSEAMSTEAEILIDYAMTFIGCSYIFGATGPNSFDCSGFTQYVFRNSGYSINRTAQNQFSNGVAVSYENLKPGDMVFFSNTYASSDWITHVGIYIGDGKMVHAANSKRGVTVDSITSGYYYSHYAGARRILN